MTQVDRTRERLIETYRKKAKHYDVTSRLYPAPGYPQRTQRLRAVRALGLRAGDTVIDMACGTGLNFPLLERAVGPDGRIVGVDLTDAMLARAQDRIETNRWGNISLVQADAAGFDFPAEVDARVRPGTGRQRTRPCHRHQAAVHHHRVLQVRRRRRAPGPLPGRARPAAPAGL